MSVTFDNLDEKAKKEIADIALQVAVPALEAVGDVPGWLEQIARCTLARSFIAQQPDSRYSFDAAAFEKAWTYIVGGPAPSSETAENQA